MPDLDSVLLTNEYLRVINGTLKHIDHTLTTMLVIMFLFAIVWLWSKL